MIKIHPLASLDADDLKCILAGYVSSAVYTVVKTETREHTAIALQLTPRSPPYVKHYDPIDDNTLARYGRVLSDGLSLGAHDGEVLVGVAIAEPHWWNKSLWVWEFHVAESHRGQGIGRGLMDTLAAKGKAAGLRTIVCETQNTNVPAIDFYRAVGFAVESIDLSYYTNDDLNNEVAVFMKRRLT